MSVDDSFVYSGKEELINMELMKRYNQGIVTLIKRYVEDDRKILDFGAGIGTLASHFPQDKIVCLEIDDEQKKHLETKGFQAVDDLAAIADDSVTFVYSSNVLEHIEDDYQAVRDIYPKIAPNGRIFFYVPAFPMLYSSMDQRVGHFRRYTKNRLNHVFQEGGFQVEEIFFSDFLGFFATLLFKLIDSKGGAASQKSLLFYDKFIYPVSSFLDKIFGRLLGKNVVIVARKR